MKGTEKEKTEKRQKQTKGAMKREGKKVLLPFNVNEVLVCLVFVYGFKTGIKVCPSPEKCKIYIITLSASARQRSFRKTTTTHYGTKPGHFETSKIHFPMSEGVSKVSERVNE